MVGRSMAVGGAPSLAETSRAANQDSNTISILIALILQCTRTISTMECCGHCLATKGLAIIQELGEGRPHLISLCRHRPRGTNVCDHCAAIQYDRHFHLSHNCPMPKPVFDKDSGEGICVACLIGPFKGHKMGGCCNCSCKNLTFQFCMTLLDKNLLFIKNILKHRNSFIHIRDRLSKHTWAEWLNGRWFPGHGISNAAVLLAAYIVYSDDKGTSISTSNDVTWGKIIQLSN